VKIFQDVDYGQINWIRSLKEVLVMAREQGIFAIFAALMTLGSDYQISEIRA